MNCTETRSCTSGYLDGALSGKEMHAIGAHLESCAECSRHYALLKQTQHLVGSLGRKQPPPELALRLRLAMSHEAAKARRRRLDAIAVRWQEALNAFMVPATAGVLSAIIFFGLLIGFFAIPGQLQASGGEDVPTMLYTPPELASSPFGIVGLGTINADSVVVEAYVDANGRVQDYRILSAPDDSKALMPELNNMLIFTTFRPATAFGRPTNGRAVLSFSKINVKG